MVSGRTEVPWTSKLTKWIFPVKPWPGTNLQVHSEMQRESEGEVTYSSNTSDTMTGKSIRVFSDAAAEIRRNSVQGNKREKGK